MCAHPGTFPWHDRISADWQRLVSASEAARLVVLAQRQTPPAPDRNNNSIPDADDPLTPAFLARWDLTNLLAAYPLQTLHHALAAVERETSVAAESTILHRDEDLTALIQRCGELLDLSGAGRSAVVPLLLAMRFLRTERMHALPGEHATDDDAGQHGPQTTPLPARDALPVAAARQLALNRRQEEDAIARYHGLVELFAPQVRFQVYRLPERLVGSRADEEQAVLLRLTDAVVKFYWETAVLAPTWTVNYFIRYARSSTPSSATEVFDTRMMEQSVHVLAEAQGARSPRGGARDAESCYALGQPVTDPTAETAVEHIAQQEWQHVVQTAITALAVRFPRQAGLFTAHLHGASRARLSAETGLSPKAVTKQLNVFRHHLRAALATTYPDSFPAVLLGRRDRYNRSALWASLHTKAYTPYQLLCLPAKHRQVLERALAAARAGARERETLLDAVCADFPDIQRQTVRRMIPTAINLLEHRHESGHQETPGGAKRRLRVEMAQHYHSVRDTNPAVWDALPERHRQMIALYCFAENQPSQAELANQLGCDASAVSRRLDQLTRAYLRTAGVDGQRR